MRLNALYVLLGQVIVTLVPLIAMPYLTRTIGPTGLGIYSLSFALASVVLALSQLGVQLYGRREIARCLDDRFARSRVFWQIFLLVSTTTVAATLLYGVVVAAAPFAADLRLAMWLQIVYLLSGVFDLSWLFNGVEKFAVLTLATLASRVLLLFAMFSAVHDKNDSLLYVALMASSFLLTALLPWVFIGRVVGRPVLGDWRPMVHLRALRYFVVPAVALQLFGVISVMVVGVLLTVEDVGQFELAFRIARAPIAFIAVLGVVLLPRAVRSVSRSDESASAEYLRKGSALTVFLASGATMLLVGTAPVLIPVYAGSGFHDAVLVLQVLAVSLMVIGWGNPLRTQVLLPRGLDKLYAASLLGGLFLTVALSVALSLHVGLPGVAIAFLLGEFFVACVQTYAIRSIVDVGRLFSSAQLYFVPAVLVCIALLVTSLQAANIVVLLWQWILGTVAYVGLVCVGEALSKRYVLIAELGSLIRRIRVRRG